MRALVVWITGAPASGKTTLARSLVAELTSLGAAATAIDGDEARSAITPAPTYSDEEREILYRALAYAARRLAEVGVLPVVAATAHSPRLRGVAREVARELFLVHARCSGQRCEERDPKALYARARLTPAGKMPGVHVAYEPPIDADWSIDTETPVPHDRVAALAGAIIAASEHDVQIR